MSKRVGAVSGETKEAILQAARNEFSKFGFQHSSLRRICSEAGVTTGAIYFFFSGKDELFETVLSQVIQPFMAYMDMHYTQERVLISENLPEKENADFEISLTLIDFYFQSRQTWDILLQHQSHPAVQSFLDTFVEKSTDHYLFLVDRVRQLHPEREPVDRFSIHQFVHMQADTMLNLISHDFSREEMIRHAHTAVVMLRAAFQAVLSM